MVPMMASTPRMWRRGVVAALLCLARAVDAPAASAQTPVTFSRDVAPILIARCASCHRPDEVGGFSLLTFADARPRAAAIARVTRNRTMPPWKPDIIPGAEIVGARRLTDGEIDTLQRWAA